MATVVRRLIYDGPESWLRTVLERSLPDGEFRPFGSIVVHTDPVAGSLNLDQAGIKVGELRNARPELDIPLPGPAGILEKARGRGGIYPVRTCGIEVDSYGTIHIGDDNRMNGMDFYGQLTVDELPALIGALIQLYREMRR